MKTKRTETGLIWEAQGKEGREATQKESNVKEGLRTREK